MDFQTFFLARLVIALSVSANCCVSQTESTPQSCFEMYQKHIRSGDTQKIVQTLTPAAKIAQIGVIKLIGKGKRFQEIESKWGPSFERHLKKSNLGDNDEPIKICRAFKDWMPLDNYLVDLLELNIIELKTVGNAKMSTLEIEGEIASAYLQLKTEAGSPASMLIFFRKLKGKWLVSDVIEWSAIKKAERLNALDKEELDQS